MAKRWLEVIVVLAPILSIALALALLLAAVGAQSARWAEEWEAVMVPGEDEGP